MTDRWTDGPTDGPTDRPRCRDACTQLTKTNQKLYKEFFSTFSCHILCYDSDASQAKSSDHSFSSSLFSSRFCVCAIAREKRNLLSPCLFLSLRMARNRWHKNDIRKWNFSRSLSPSRMALKPTVTAQFRILRAGTQLEWIWL